VFITTWGGGVSLALVHTGPANWLELNVNLQTHKTPFLMTHIVCCFIWSELY